MLPNNMQHQFWVTKKSVLRKLGGKEDECIVSSDAELDAKLELFKSVNDSCLQLQRIIDLYQERLCFLAQEENALGRYLKECSKSEKNASAGQLMSTAGKALAYTGHQRLTVRPPLVRLHHEVETFRLQAISDTRNTVSEMEKSRTEYRAALSWMKSASSQLDPDTGHGLEKFRKSQSYVKTSKTKFDRYTLACLQKVDLLAAARCNMFSHALVPYHNALNAFATKALETLTLAANKLQKVEPYDFSVVTELIDSPESLGSDRKPKKTLDKDKDRSTFFNAEYKDYVEESTSTLLGDDFIPAPQPGTAKLDQSKPSSELLNQSDLADLLGDNASFMPSNLLQDFEFDVEKIETKKEEPKKVDLQESSKNMSWLSLFAELDPLANGVMENNVDGDRA